MMVVAGGTMIVLVVDCGVVGAVGWREEKFAELLALLGSKNRQETCKLLVGLVGGGSSSWFSRGRWTGGR